MIYDALIVGGGPAGITAAIYLKRAGKSVAIIEKFVPGGQLNMLGKIENYPGIACIDGTELAVKLYEQANSLDIQFIFEEAQDFQFGEVKKVICSKHTYEAKNLILALGSFTKPLSVPGENELRGKGVSYCATCDGHFFKDKNVAVVGNGDSAIVDAMYLSGVAKKVYLLCDNLQPVRVKASLVTDKANVEILREVKPVKIVGAERVEAVVYTDSKCEKTLKVDAVFVAVGRAPDTEKLKDKLELTEQGYIKVDGCCRTSSDGVYAVGDVREGALKQVVTAASDGALAANNIIECLG